MRIVDRAIMEGRPPRRTTRPATRRVAIWRVEFHLDRFMDGVEAVPPKRGGVPEKIDALPDFCNFVSKY